MKVYAIPNGCSGFVFYNEKGEIIPKESFAEYEIKAGSREITLVKFTHPLTILSSEAEVKERVQLVTNHSS